MDSRKVRQRLINLNEERYRIHLEKILKDGGSFDDLDATNPEDFGLPSDETWVCNKWGSDYKQKTKTDLIAEVMSPYYNALPPDLL